MKLPQIRFKQSGQFCPSSIAAVVNEEAIIGKGNLKMPVKNYIEQAFHS
jgi:hypothetical protein